MIDDFIKNPSSVSPPKKETFFNSTSASKDSLIENEGLSLGTSSGINIAGAIKLGKELGPGNTIITVLSDKSDRYQSKLFNKQFLKEKNLPIPKWL